MKPWVGITLGDPAGVGPEVTIRALGDEAVARALHPLVIGDLELLRETATRLRSRLRFMRVAAEELGGDGDDAVVASRTVVGRGGNAVPVLTPSPPLSVRARRPGKASLEGGRAAYRYILTATDLARRGVIAGIVTAPINKAIVTRAGFPISGHTELLKELTGAREVRMMLAGDRLKVVLVTTHVAHAAVSGALTMRDVTRTIIVTGEHLRQHHGIASPRLALAALNPHAGEGGLFGREEQTILSPAAERARRAGVPVSGPHPADSLFVRAVSGEFDAVIAIYHDQGLIPLKLLHFHDAVNVTLGLPILRTSPDHGTAYDIAGLGRANPGSMRAALLMIARMAAADRRGPRAAHARKRGTSMSRPLVSTPARAASARRGTR